jgi:Tol biopolymer transport system component
VPLFALPASGWSIKDHTELISQTPAHAAGNGSSGGRGVSLSRDGRYVAFSSDARNLVKGDTNGVDDIFVRDRESGVTRRVSLTSAEQQGAYGSVSPSVSPDGRYVAFESLSRLDRNAPTTPGQFSVYVRDRELGTTTAIGRYPNGALSNTSFGPRISPDGRYVTFLTPYAGGIYLRDLVAHTTALVRVQLPPTSPGTSWTLTSAVPSMNATMIAVEAVNQSDTTGKWSVFVVDRSKGSTTPVSVDLEGRLAAGMRPSISANGRVIEFQSETPLTPGASTPGVYLRDVTAGITRWVAKGNLAASWDAALSADGRFVGYSTFWVAYVHSMSSGQNFIISRSPTGDVIRKGYFLDVVLSPDGHAAAFDSTTPNVTSQPDTNGTRDVFLRVPATQ